jgi:hypothetical protein
VDAEKKGIPLKDVPVTAPAARAPVVVIVDEPLLIVPNP